VPSYLPVPADVIEDPAAFLDRITDIPSSAPAFPVPVSEAGIGEQEVFLQLAGFGEAPEMMPVHGTVSASASLGGTQRGVHMSRIVESVQAVSGTEWPALDDFISALALDVARRQGLGRSRVRFDGQTQIPARAPVSGRLSLNKWGVHAEAACTDGVVTSRAGLTATIITACPCTRAYSWHTAVIGLAGVIGIDTANAVGAGLVTYTHSQRATVTVMVDGGNAGIPLPECYEAIRAGAHVVYELLKRPDEHFLVRQAHERPQFTEDVVREVAARIAAQARGPARDQAAVTVTSAAVESIHAHTVRSKVEGTLAELRGYLAGSRHE
jgi:GTP cyclohydrolase IV